MPGASHDHFPGITNWTTPVAWLCGADQHKHQLWSPEPLFASSFLFHKRIMLWKSPKGMICKDRKWRHVELVTGKKIKLSPVSGSLWFYPWLVCLTKKKKNSSNIKFLSNPLSRQLKLLKHLLHLPHNYQNKDAQPRKVTHSFFSLNQLYIAFLVIICSLNRKMIFFWFLPNLTSMCSIFQNWLVWSFLIL